MPSCPCDRRSTMNEHAPPFDERLDALKKDSRISSAYVELIADNARRLSPTSADFGEQLHRITGRLMTLEMHVNHGFDRTDRRFGHLDWRFDQIGRRFDQTDRRFDQTDRRSERIDLRLEQIDKNIWLLSMELLRVSAEVSRISTHLGIKAPLQASDTVAPPAQR